VATKTFNDRLREALKERRIKYITLAKAVGVSRSAVSKWCNTNRMVSSKLLVPLSEATGISILWLLTGQHAERHHTLRERKLIDSLLNQDRKTQEAIEVILRKIRKN